MKVAAVRAVAAVPGHCSREMLDQDAQATQQMPRQCTARATLGQGPEDPTAFVSGENSASQRSVEASNIFQLHLQIG